MFLSIWYFAPRVLHSFPTRRSSDLSPPSFQRWILDLASPGLLRMLQKNMGRQLSQGGASLKFGPKEGPEFFTPYGWKREELDRKSTRLNSSHLGISYAVFCLKKKTR